MIGEAIDTAVAIGWALAAWIAVGAAVATVVIIGGLATGAWAVRGLWRHTTGPSWARGRVRARILARHRTRRPHSHTGEHDYQEAA